MFKQVLIKKHVPPFKVSLLTFVFGIKSDVLESPKVLWMKTVGFADLLHEVIETPAWDWFAITLSL